LEAPDTYEKLQSDPRSFLSGDKQVIIDEAQKMPELFSYIQVISDELNKPGKFILSGSQNFLLQNQISQSLAGRVYNTVLLPPDLSELKSGGILKGSTPDDAVFRGFYPRVIANNISPEDFYPAYIQTYVERDVRDVLRIGNPALFQKFMRVLAGRAGRMLNLSAIGNEVGVDHKTIGSWISVLQSSYLIFLLQPYEKNYNKRIVKTPKLYFYDTGLLCSLLGIHQADTISQHWAKGELFENLVIADIQKRMAHIGKGHIQLFFWRDQTGNEVDCIYEFDGRIFAIEIKSSATYRSEFLKGLNYFKSLQDKESPEPNLQLVYAGNDEWTDSNSNIKILPWHK
jgi:predicted AAA+ superfamily ATPase